MGGMRLLIPALEEAAIREGYDAMSFGQVIDVFALISFAVRPDADALAVDLVVFKLPVEHAAVGPGILPNAMEAIVEPFSAVYVTVEVAHRALAMPYASSHVIAFQHVALDPFAIVSAVWERNERAMQVERVHDNDSRRLCARPNFQDVMPSVHCWQALNLRQGWHSDGKKINISGAGINIVSIGCLRPGLSQSRSVLALDTRSGLIGD